MNKRIRELMNTAVFTDKVPPPTLEEICSKFATSIVDDCLTVLDDIYHDVKVLDPVDNADKDFNIVMMTTLKVAKRRIREKLSDV